MVCVTIAAAGMVQSEQRSGTELSIAIFTAVKELPE
jgi:hypothetical protein